MGEEQRDGRGKYEEGWYEGLSCMQMVVSMPMVVFMPIFSQLDDSEQTKRKQLWSRVDSIESVCTRIVTMPSHYDFQILLKTLPTGHLAHGLSPDTFLLVFVSPILQDKEPHHVLLGVFAAAKKKSHLAVWCLSLAL